MVLQLCPVLGDHRYSARMGTVLGQRFLLPAESTKPQRQVPKLTCLVCLLGVGWGTRVGRSPDLTSAAWDWGAVPLGFQSYPCLAVWP